MTAMNAATLRLGIGLALVIIGLLITAIGGLSMGPNAPIKPTDFETTSNEVVTPQPLAILVPAGFLITLTGCICTMKQMAVRGWI